MPHWTSQSIFYHIYPLGLCGAPYTNDFTSASTPRLEKIHAWLDHIQSLEANALYLGPLFESSSHGYDTADYYWVDRQVNDTYGQYADDQALKHLALHLTRNPRQSDLIFRLGGNEFLLIFPNLSTTIAFGRADQFRNSFQESTVLLDQVKIRTTLSIGIASFPDHGVTSQEILAAADRALYAAKASGRNRVISC